MRMKFFPLFFLISLISVIHLSAQSNNLIDNLLSQKEAAFGDTALLVLTAGRLIPEDSGTDAAIKYVAEKIGKLSGKKADNHITAAELSFIIMKTFNLKGGIMYMLFPGPRYAYRELVYRKDLSGRGGPYRKVPGEEVLRTLRQVMDKERIK